jgi:hypothetical protein
MNRHLGAAAAAWGILGAAGLLGLAILRLQAVALEAFTSGPLGARAWLTAIVTATLVGYFMGQRGLARGFAPRVVSRALHLARHPRPLHAALAPLYCIGLIHAPRRRVVSSWALVATMAGLVAVVRRLPQPMRGFVDAGVVVGAAWGVAAVLFIAWRAFGGRPPSMAIELPAANARHAS